MDKRPLTLSSAKLTRSPLSSPRRTYPKVLPASDLIIERVARTGSGHHLSVALQDEVGDQSPAADGAGRQLIPHQPHGVLGGQPDGVVPDEGNPVAHRVVSQGVGPLPQPAPALVDVPVGACDEAFEGTRRANFRRL